MTKPRNNTSVSEDTDDSDFVKKHQDEALTSAVDLMISKTKEHGRLPHGSMRKILLNLSKLGVYTDRDHLYYLKDKRVLELLERERVEQERLERQTNDPPVEDIEINNQSETTLSSLENSTEKLRGRPRDSSIATKAEKNDY
jgi:hypothetical protein